MPCVIITTGIPTYQQVCIDARSAPKPPHILRKSGAMPRPEQAFAACRNRRNRIIVRDFGLKL